MDANEKRKLIIEALDRAERVSENTSDNAPLVQEIARARRSLLNAYLLLGGADATPSS